MRSIVIAALAALAFASAANATPHCTANSQQCGNACIAKNLTCHVAPPKKPVCDPAKSKPCGNACIAKDKTCHVNG